MTGDVHRQPACSLAAGEAAARSERWRRLMERDRVSREETAAGLRMTFRAGAEAELRSLAALERECCGFADWTVERRANELVLEVTSTGDGAETVRRLFGRDSNTS